METLKFQLDVILSKRLDVLGFSNGANAICWPIGLMKEHTLGILWSLMLRQT